MSDPEHAFQELSRIFSTRDNQVLEIEIVPSHLGLPLIQDGSSVGITKKALVQALPVARRLFFDRLMTMTEHDFRASLSRETKPGKVPDAVISEILLLCDCEHLTACNWRKRRLLAAVTSGLNPVDESQTSSGDLLAVQLLETELTLLTTYLCSPLHRHTKSPTLWHHRLWVLKQLFKVKKGCDDCSITPPKLLSTELAIVLRAGELHPKNYYAFSYMRQLHTLLASIATDQPNLADDSARSMIKPLLDWCCAYPRDISGWMFAVYLLQNVTEHAIRVDGVTRVLRFARDVGWEGESLWTFIYQAVRQFHLKDVVNDILGCGLPLTGNADPQKPAYLTWLTPARKYWAENKRST